MKIKPILGHIPCPTCAASMRITHDKNDDPFGYCEDGCGQQLRVGGNPARVREFVKRYPFAAKPGAAPAPKEPEKIPVTVTEPKPAPAPTPEPVPAPVKRRSSFDDALSMLGVKP